jgi:hypothetical protein
VNVQELLSLRGTSVIMASMVWGVRGLGVLFAAALALALATTAHADVVWLCKPGAEPNPCVGDLTTTIQRPDGTDRVLPATIPKRRPIDCFYVYPTVSEDPSTNSDKSRDPEMDAIARFQAQRLSRYCRVYAPIYRQRTLAAIAASSTDPEPYNLAFGDVVEAWNDYLANYNHGRGFAVIGHSQGSRMLRGLIRNYVDDRPSVRRRLVGAFIPGANVLVRKGENAHGDFDNVPGCRRPGQFGCVVAWSAFNETPPADSRFGRSPTTPDTSVLALPSGPDYEVLCTDPERLTNGSGRLTSLTRSDPYPGIIGVLITLIYGGSPPTAATPWLSPRERYTGHCTSADGANYLDVQPIGDARHLNPAPDRTWGLHILDLNLAYGEIEQILVAQTASYLGAR